MSYKFSKEELEELLIDYNKIALNNLNINLPESVSVWDETLRDGEQSPTVYLTLDEKIHLAKLMDEIGVKLIAVGFPAVSASELTIVKTIMNESFENSTILSIARPRESDIDSCLDANAEEVVLFMPISPIFRKTLKQTTEKQLELVKEGILYAKDNGLKVNWVCEDGTRCDYGHLIKVCLTAIEAGAERIIIGDTVGVLTPYSTSYLINRLKEDIKYVIQKDIPLGIHTHNDFGLAVSNTITAVMDGCTYPHTCINGYGERAGNAALEEVVTILERLGIKTGIDLTKLPELSEVCEKYFCKPLSPYKPIVGDYAFSHESGLHIAAILAHPLTYEPINPRMVGRRRKFYLGKFSGSQSIIHALQSKIKVIDLDIPEEIIKKIVNDVKAKHESRSKEELRESFRIIKEELKKIYKGVTDREFFEIVNKYAQPYVPDEFKPKNKNSSKKEKNS